MIDAEVAASIRSPGVQMLSGGEPIVHRSHLPLLAAIPAGATLHVEGVPVAGTNATITRICVAYSGVFPRSWQVDAGRFVAVRHASLVRFDPRMGKTYVAVAAHEPSSGPLVIAGPLAAGPVWETWVRKRWPAARYLHAEGRMLDPRVLSEGFDAIFIHYGLLPSWTALGLKIGTLVLDEPHLLYTHRTQRAAALYTMAPRAHRIIALDGTPVWNRPEGLWSLLSLLAPGAWGSFRDYAIRYASGQAGPYGLITGEPSNVDELHARLSEVVIDRSWEGEGLLDRTVVTVPLDDATWTEVTAAAQAVRHAGLAIVTLGAMRQRLAVAKRAVVLDQIAAVLKRESHVVVWAWFRETAREIGRALDAAGVQYEVVTGEGATADREDQIDRWRARGGALVITLGAGQVAIDLSAARTEIVAELDWTPNVHVQADYRIVRPDRSARCIYVVAEHPVEQAVAAAIIKKSEGSRAIGFRLFDEGAAALKHAFGLDDPGDLVRLEVAIREGHPDE